MILKTPLRYPGGKSRATKKLFANLPEFKRYREPFLGGGSCALEISRRYNVPIWVNDKYTNLYLFWKELQENSEMLYSSILKLKTKADEYQDSNQSHRELFLESREAFNEPLDQHWTAVRFYICNKCSFSGLGESSGFSGQASQQNFSYNNIEKLKLYGPLIKEWLITNLDYTDIISDSLEDEFIFLDPPYDIKSGLYGKKGQHHINFDHVKLEQDLSELKSKIMITYNSNAEIRNLYKNWNQSEWDLTYTMHSSKVYRDDEKNRKELLITNYE